MALQHKRAHLKKRADDGENAERIIKTIYTTLDKTFEGPVGGYATLVRKDDESLALAPSQTSLAVDGSGEDGAPTAITGPQTTLADATSLALETGEVSVPPPTATDSEGSTITSEVSNPTSSSDQSTGGGEEEGTSAGVKAGIAFGVLGGVLLVGLIVYFAFSRRRKRAQQASPENGSEKFDAGAAAGGARSIPMQNNNRAPRVSLRPVTQFFSGFNGDDKRSSKGLGLSLPPSAGAASPGPSPFRAQPSPNPFDRPSTSQSTRSLDPFGINAERPVSPISEEASMYSRRSPSPVSNRSVYGVAASGNRQTSMHADIQNMDFTLPPPSRGAPSPTGTEFSMSSVTPGMNAPPSSGAAAIAAAGGPRNTAVHRVQLDFKPTLEDEMELKGGELVRLLHEYDDGWALCIRLDRSRQGVVPRTCLSTRPVKPRVAPGATRNGPPINPQHSTPHSPARPRTATGPGPAHQSGLRGQPYGRQQQGPGGPAPGQAM